MSHPYQRFEGSDLWRLLDHEIGELEGNGDLELTTARQYVIGYLCQQLVAARLASTRTPDTPAS